MVMLCEAIKAGTTTMVDSNEEMLFFAGNHVKIGIRAQFVTYCTCPAFGKG